MSTLLVLVFFKEMRKVEENEEKLRIRTTTRKGEEKCER